MTRKEFVKLCTNLLSSVSVRRTLSNHPVNCCLCFSNRRSSTFQTTLRYVSTRKQTANTTLFQHSRPCIPSLTNFNNHKNDFCGNFRVKNLYSVSTNASDISRNDCMEFSDPDTKKIISRDMQVIYDFVSEEEEEDLFNEVEPYLRRLRYESSHWDDAIHGYRETERKSWSEKNKSIIQRVRDAAFPPGTPQLTYVHVLDLQKEGYIKPHVDAVKFCGSTIAGISLLSPCVMRLVHTENKTKFADILLERRSLYIMKDSARYDYTHEVLPDESLFRGKSITKDRRISVICRNEP
ncbi:alpha-ketoglutarate-dependent dioxygenase alkB homolog 7, mitochondrial-like [Mercenaria mercenaria]|uniref:alpha-ketoglutarate-dependent dioxygenase alkB homolog 7, mitochondrial-like n=1 Tax=Mercenaria mercenaria TaxID=6596 RepID=UPI00234E47BA|nr:alpha-ketoglutarate-dependent dioxygenase alkB homolog 7, mitochondrial-like [Mercenaria mercenaria]